MKLFNEQYLRKNDLTVKTVTQFPLASETTAPGSFLACLWER